MHPEAVYDQNEIDEEIANIVDKHAAVGPIRNMHVHEDAHVRSTKHAYDQANEVADDDDYDEVANEYSEENGNAHGCNGDDNDRGEGGVIGAAASGNNDAASVGSGSGGSSNVPQKEQFQKTPNQGVEIQDNPPPSNMNVNSQVPNVVIPVINNPMKKTMRPSITYILMLRKKGCLLSAQPWLASIDRHVECQGDPPDILDPQWSVQFLEPQ